MGGYGYGGQPPAGPNRQRSRVGGGIGDPVPLAGFVGAGLAIVAALVLAALVAGVFLVMVLT